MGHHPGASVIVAEPTLADRMRALAATRDAADPIAVTFREAAAQVERLQYIVSGPRDHPTFDAAKTEDLRQPENAAAYAVAVEFYLGRGFMEVPEWEDIGADFRFGFRSVGRAIAALAAERDALREGLPDIAKHLRAYAVDERNRGEQLRGCSYYGEWPGQQFLDNATLLEETAARIDTLLAKPEGQ